MFASTVKRMLMKLLKLPALVILLSSFMTTADIYDDISNSIRAGNAKQLAGFVGANIDLTIGSQEAVYSKTQAEQILRDFFTKNAPKSFTILHKGASKEGTQYAIGTYLSSNGKSFRTSFYFKHSDNAYVIKELHFETD
jgi:hypothetical protein